MFKTSDAFFLTAAIASMFLAAALWVTGNQLEGIFVALWVPSILAFAIYIKLLSLKARFAKHAEETTNIGRNINE